MIFQKGFYFLASLLLLLNFISCDSNQSEESLRIYNRHSEVNGEKEYEKIRNFSFVNQDSTEITNKTFEGKLYISNYFFTSCPSICPKISKSMLRIYDHFEKEDRLMMLSHSIDTKYDTIPALKRYADDLQVNAPKWNFVTGEESKVLVYLTKCTVWF